MIPLNLAIRVTLFAYIFDIFALSIKESIWEFKVFQKQVIFFEYR